MNKLQPNRTAMVDQILAVLRDAQPLPLGTTAIGRALGPWRPTWTRSITCPHCGSVHTCQRPASYVRDSHPAYTFHGLLKRLARQGVIERIPKVKGPRMDAHGQDYWRYLGPQS